MPALGVGRGNVTGEDTAAWKTGRVGGAGDKKFECWLSRLGLRETQAHHAHARDALRSWVALSLSGLLEGTGCSQAHAQTRACPVDFRHAHSGAPAPQPHMTDLGLSRWLSPSVASPPGLLPPWPWQCLSGLWRPRRGCSSHRHQYLTRGHPGSHAAGS